MFHVGLVQPMVDGEVESQASLDWDTSHDQKGMKKVLSRLVENCSAPSRGRGRSLVGPNDSGSLAFASSLYTVGLSQPLV